MVRVRYSHTTAILAAIVAIISIFGLARFVFEVSLERAKLSDLVLSYADVEQKNARVSSMRAILRDTQGMRDELASLTAQNDPIETIRLLEDVGRSARITMAVETVTPGGPTAIDPSLGSFLVTLSAYGTFGQLYQFLSRLETLPMPSVIDRVHLEHIEKTWRMSITIRIFSNEET